MSTTITNRPIVVLPWLAARANLHVLILTGMVAGALLLYAHTTVRYGHTMHTTDGYMYYTHARSWYFDGDCDYENDLRITPPSFKHSGFYLGWRSPTGKVMNLFPCGWSMIALPFVAVADLLTIAHNALFGSELTRDGYSVYYRVVVPLAHVLTGIAGLLLTYALIARYFPKTTAAIATAAAWCGTNAIYYVSLDPTMPHAASMAFVAGMIWTADTIRRDGWSPRRAAGLGFCCGMMVGVRHHNIAWMVVPLILLLPSLVVGVARRRPGAVGETGLAGLAAATALLSLVPQVIVNLSAQGAVVGQVAKWTPHWFEPHLVPQLFSRSTGLFIIYPLAAVGLIGAIVYACRNRGTTLPAAMVAGFAAIVYLNAAYPWCPSPRRYVCGVAVLALGLAAVVQWASHTRARTVGLAVVLGVLCTKSLAMVSDPAGKFF